MADKQQPSTDDETAAKAATTKQDPDKTEQATPADAKPADKPKPTVTAEALAAVQKKADDFEDKYLRAEAEVQNMQTRYQKEQAALIKYDGQQLAKDVLPVIDNLERALAVDATDETSKQIKKGVQMTYDHMEDALKRNHVTEIAALGQKFDPTLHQAVQSVPVSDGQTAETVVNVLQKGYQLKDRVLRPAMVVVAQ
ncbi:MAG: nucleotide exchange factor GrpE [Levilactobacillus sp.]|uniref:Protein GrpE n=1 Tax=Levilactobacillus suantsaiihabitans TaxID=2487722 RepID=A0A4Z0JAN8_9LACO|nr:MULTISPECIES: nucleotide exchange factor GrpE [Levilactobacillus]MCH4123239.1 nucleotide exchange factor GrpE [Levilactobacillus sp.]MCI1552623.1 nucleotide exchange factor GrpE [Levilactobacillus sp.]MCI1599368.1 nucleotide exchange factor GrpE [Levilactobacillus sp.]TGD18698.1 nucleotide exchange factor GrpE [Levilactobacillus suantsaiihabitans]